MKKIQNRLSVYQRLESRLRSFFKLFDNMCVCCFMTSLSLVRNGIRPNQQDFCCCLVDNQLSDYWLLLDQVQKSTRGPNWSCQLPTKLDTGRRRLPGGGPCRALTCNGCSLDFLRPPTCNTQLCKSMIEVLLDLHLIERNLAKSREVLQIEEILGVSSPLDYLYGVQKKLIPEYSVEVYVERLESYTKQFCAVEPEKRRIAVNSALERRIAKMQRGH